MKTIQLQHAGNFIEQVRAACSTTRETIATATFEMIGNELFVSVQAESLCGTFIAGGNVAIGPKGGWHNEVVRAY